ncbi:hypothetical protein [Pseudonocardia sp. HH130630-07]|uniref:hypothetical protein n=1 Tax=Pseudonocardia sp. HH130630-07 TaxID=1690815 RepID=UPI0008152904|nr:hypothetical protein [Pseudonocardia sp. HH130630-07]ANY05761.1 hypothetical protein AFB00_04950 [Pseudonocardia sp. HH130630-07]
MNERDRRRIEQLRADRMAVRDAAGVVRSAPELQSWPGLHTARRAEELGDLLDGLAEHLHTLDEQIRSHVVRVCTETLGRPMDNPTTRRTRRR